MGGRGTCEGGGEGGQVCESRTVEEGGMCEGGGEGKSWFVGFVSTAVYTVLSFPYHFLRGVCGVCVVHVCMTPAATLIIFIRYLLHN